MHLQYSHHVLQLSSSQHDINMHNMIIEDEHDLSAPIQQLIELPDPEVETVENDENA